MKPTAINQPPEYSLPLGIVLIGVFYLISIGISLVWGGSALLHTVFSSQAPQTGYSTAAWLLASGLFGVAILFGLWLRRGWVYWMLVASYSGNLLLYALVTSGDPSYLANFPVYLNQPIGSAIINLIILIYLLSPNTLRHYFKRKQVEPLS